MAYMIERYLTCEEVAEIRRKTTNALSMERKRGDGPPYIPDGGRILYRESDLVAWLDARRVSPEAAMASGEPQV